MLMLCPICAEEFYLRLLACPTCGCNLIPETLSEGIPMTITEKENREIKFVELCRPKLYPVALFIKETLEQNGIITLVKGGNAISLLPHLAFGGELRVLVDSQQIEFARELYQAYFENQENIDYLPES